MSLLLGKFSETEDPNQIPEAGFTVDPPHRAPTVVERVFLQIMIVSLNALWIEAAPTDWRVGRPVRWLVGSGTLAGWLAARQACSMRVGIHCTKQLWMEVGYGR